MELVQTLVSDAKSWAPLINAQLFQQGGGLEPQLSYKWEPTLFEWLAGAMQESLPGH